MKKPWFFPIQLICQKNGILFNYTTFFDQLLTVDRFAVGGATKFLDHFSKNFNEEKSFLLTCSMLIMEEKKEYTIGLSLENNYLLKRVYYF